jgi:thiamine pyrophosphate-dependent acetolactate synthase large subunit-like protein
MKTIKVNTSTIDRREFVAALLAKFPEALVVTGLGSPSYDVFAAGDRPGNFHRWGAMGGATPLALGLALAQPDRTVMVITGDGEQLMGIGSLATAAAVQPPNLNIIVLDNGHYGETGMQASHTSLGTNLASAARGFGIANALEIHSFSEIETLASHIKEKNGVTLAQVFIDNQEFTRVLPPRDGVYVKNRFRDHLGFHVN